MASSPAALTDPYALLWMPSCLLRSIFDKPNSSWPFTNITREDFIVLQSEKILSNWTLRICGSLVSALGMIWTSLLICSLWKQTVVLKNSFYTGMMFVAMADLTFNSLSLIFNAAYTTFRIDGSAESTGIWIMVGVRGLVFTTSLVSDLSTVILTFERFISIAKPHLHQKLFHVHKEATHVVLGGFVFLISITRMHYSIDITVDKVGNTYFYTESDLSSEDAVMAMTMISDTILPMILLVIMVVLSSSFRVAVLRREKKRLAKLNLTRRLTNASCLGAALGTVSREGTSIDPPKPSEWIWHTKVAPVEMVNQQLATVMGQSRRQSLGTQVGALTAGVQSRRPSIMVPQSRRQSVIPAMAQAVNQSRRQSVIPAGATSRRQSHGQQPAKSESNSDHRSMLVLTLTLDSLFLMNQIGYCVYWTFNFLLESGTLSFDSTKEELVNYMRINRYLNYADIGVSLSECLSHSLNFPLYVALSGSMRKEFFGFLKRVHRFLRNH